MDPVPTFNWAFANRQLASEILTQPCRYKRAESNLIADEKGHHQRDLGSCLVIHLYFILKPLRVKSRWLSLYKSILISVARDLANRCNEVVLL